MSFLPNWVKIIAKEVSKWTKEGSLPFPFKNIFFYIIPFIERDSIWTERNMKNQSALNHPLTKEYTFLRSLIIWSQTHKEHSVPYLGKHCKHYKLNIIPWNQLCACWENKEEWVLSCSCHRMLYRISSREEYKNRYSFAFSLPKIPATAHEQVWQE